MKKVAIYAQSYAISGEEELKILLKVLNQYKIEAYFEQKFYDLLQKHNCLKNSYPVFTHFNDLSDDFDLMFSMGGDGTILRSVTYIRNLNIPILGINTGRLGFLATVQKDQIEKAVQLLIEKSYTIQERTLLQVETTPESEGFKDLNFALNEVTVARKNTTSMIGIDTSLNNEYLTNYWADGLIVSTPTGSTGYSLSCGGPVVLPNSKNIILTPIAPHNLNARPLIITDNTTIQLEISSREDSYLISLDSRINSVSTSTKLKIKKASFKIKTILLKDQSFLKTLRGKLLWGEDTRNKTFKQ